MSIPCHLPWVHFFLHHNFNLTALQAVVEDNDLTDALRRTFLLPSGERRRGLSLHDQRQGLILFLLTARRKLEMRTCSCWSLASWAAAWSKRCALAAGEGGTIRLPPILAREPAVMAG